MTDKQLLTVFCKIWSLRRDRLYCISMPGYMGSETMFSNDTVMRVSNLRYIINYLNYREAYITLTRTRTRILPY